MLNIGTKYDTPKYGLNNLSVHGHTHDEHVAVAQDAASVAGHGAGHGAMAAPRIT